MGMQKMKLKVSGVGIKAAEQREGGYNGPELVGGTYVVRLKRMVHAQIGIDPKTGKKKDRYTGQNLGADRFNCMFEVVEPDQWKGAAIWEGINVIDGDGLQYVNQFLHALSGAETNGQKKAIESAFYDGDLVTEGVASRKYGYDEDHVKRIGKLVNVNSPQGEVLLKVVIRMDRSENPPRAKVVSYLAYDGELPQPQAKSTDETTDLLGDLATGLDEHGPESQMADSAFQGVADQPVLQSVPDAEPDQNIGDEPPF